MQYYQIRPASYKGVQSEHRQDNMEGIIEILICNNQDGLGEAYEIKASNFTSFTAILNNIHKSDKCENYSESHAFICYMFGTAISALEGFVFNVPGQLFVNMHTL